MAYFDLLYMRSYKTAGPSKEQKYYQKGKPVEITDEADIAFLQGQPEIFIQVDDQGNRVMPEAKTTENRTYKRFREQNLLFEDAEDLLNKVHEQAKTAPPRNVNHLLEAVNADAIIPAEVKDVTKEGTIVSDDLPKGPTGSAKKTKVAANACPKFSRKFKSSEELEQHLADHDGE